MTTYIVRWENPSGDWEEKEHSRFDVEQWATSDFVQEVRAISLTKLLDQKKLQSRRLIWLKWPRLTQDSEQWREDDHLWVND